MSKLTEKIDSMIADEQARLQQQNDRIAELEEELIITLEDLRERDACIAELESAPTWIVDEDRMPKMGEWVLVTAEGDDLDAEVFIGCFIERGGRAPRWENPNGYELIVSAWRPLPAPYEVTE